MISDPETAGQAGGAEPREVMSDHDREGGEHRPRRPWLWALGGMVAASVLWAAALSLYGFGDGKPDTHGYRLGEDTCASLRLESLGTALAGRPLTMGAAQLLRHPALDEMGCSIVFEQPTASERSGSEQAAHYRARVTIALHRKTDPGPEFEARRGTTVQGFEAEVKLEEVPGLGDKAYLLTHEEGLTLQELRVLEGGAVFSLQLTAIALADSSADASAGSVDLAPYRSAMIADMRDLMSGLERDSR